MNIQETLKHLAKQKETLGRLTNASIATLRQAAIDDGVIRFTVGHLLPLPGEAEVVDEQAREECRRFLHDLGDNGGFVSLEVRYTKDTPSKPDKRIGMPYTFTGKTKCHSAVKGDKDPATQAEQHHRNGTMAFWCCDTQRRTGDPESRWRSAKVGAVSAVFIGGTRIPVEYIKPNGEKVDLHWIDAPIRQMV
jgi:hypothetical protein